MKASRFDQKRRLLCKNVAENAALFFHSYSFVLVTKRLCPDNDLFIRRLWRQISIVPFTAYKFIAECFFCTLFYFLK